VSYLKDNLKVYIIHVAGNEERRQHIEKQLAGKDFDYEFILYGNMEDITEEILEKYFAGELDEVSPATSCALKHITAYKRIIEAEVPFALILEDDIRFLPSFMPVFEKSLKEIEENGIESVFVSYEDSNLKYVKGSKREENKVLYKNTKGRLAGAYGVDKQAAEAMINYLEENKCHKPVDWFHNECAEEGLFDIYWSHPAIARQSSKTGETASLIGGKGSGLIRTISFNLQKAYKKILYYFR
jgi:glycosyl transferase family 25